MNLYLILSVIAATVIFALISAIELDAKEKVEEQLKQFDYYIDDESRHELFIIAKSAIIGFIPLINAIYIIYMAHEHQKLIHNHEQWLIERVKVW